MRSYVVIRPHDTDNDKTPLDKNPFVTWEGHRSVTFDGKRYTTGKVYRLGAPQKDIFADVEVCGHY